MIWTRATVADFAREKGLEPIQIDGIPEGFAWKEPDVTIGDKEIRGRTVIFTPLTDKVTYE